MKFDGMKMPQLLTLILSDGEESQAALWYVITVRQREKLLGCFKASTDPKKTYDAGKTFEDYLSDFYLYLYEGHPVKENQPPHFYFLSTIKDKSKFSSWLPSTFCLFLKDYQRTFFRLLQLLSDYLHTKEDANPEKLNPVSPIALSLARFNQRKSAETRYFFFRKLRSEVVKDFTRMEELTDEETAAAMNINRTTIFRRVQEARKEVRESMEAISQTDLMQLNPLNMKLAERISDMDNGDLSEIVMDLMDDAERELPCYTALVEARNKKLQKLFAVEDEKMLALNASCEREQLRKREMDFLADFVDRFNNFVAKKR